MKTHLLPALGVCSILLWACGQDGQQAPEVNSNNDAMQTSNTVPYEEAVKLVANYAPRAGYVVRDGEALPNSRSVWFPVEQLSTLVDKLEQEGGDGLRIYFAAYDSTYTQGQAHVPPPEYWGYNTVLLVSTRDSVANGQHYHRDYYGSAAIENFGSLCPPPKDCNDVGATLIPAPPKN